MKLYMIITMGFFCILIVGCSETVEKSQDRHLINSELINSYNDIALQNAVISQHTLFPYHFVKNGAEFNELGQHDFSVLTKYFMEHPGRLNIRRKDCPVNLYQARVNFVLEELKEASIDAEQIRISDGMPGGSGMSSGRVLIILQDAYKPSSTKTSTTTYKSGG